MILYSTNVYLKHQIQVQFFNDIHYVWCSDHFDSQKLASYTPGFALPPSSNPADIYKQIKAECARPDRHGDKITAQIASFTKLASIWASSGVLSVDDADEINYRVKHATPNDWRPLLYLIPKAPVEARLKKVPIDKRASNAMEYILDDLQGSEFHIIEP